MYSIIEKGLGKKVCNQDGCTLLTESLSQAKLKRLFKLNCEFVSYAEATKREETPKFEEVPATDEEDTTDQSNGFARRKQNTRKGTKKS